MLNQKRLSTAASLLAALAASNATGQTSNWVNAVSGSWETPANWDNGIPVASTGVAGLGLSGAYVVSLNSTRSIDSVNISNPDAVLNITPARTLTLLGSSSINNGTIELNTAASSANSVLGIPGVHAFNGMGEIHLAIQNDDSQIFGAGTLVNSASHTIRGVGDLRVEIVNNGLIAADISVSSFGTTLDAIGDITNNASMRSEPGSVLSLSGVTVDQTGGGSIVAADTAQVNVTGADATILGGTIGTEGNGEMNILTGGIATLESVYSNSFIDVNPAGRLHVAGSGLINDGIIAINRAASSADSFLIYVESGVLDGDGEVQMQIQNADAQFNTAVDATVTQSTSHTIRGVGDINASLVNNGTVMADIAVSSFGTALNLRSEDKVNNNVMGAAAGSDLYISSVTIDQTAGGVLVANDGTIRLNSATIEGGVYNATGTGSMQTNTGASLLSGLTLNGPLGMNAGHTVRVDGDGMTNNGVISMNPLASSADVILNFTDNATLDGNGEINLKSQGADTQINTDPTFVITQASTHLIRGVGRINAGIVNNGEIRADVSVATFGDFLELISNDKVNNNVMGAAPGSDLFISNITIDQTAGGVLVANDGTIRLNSATIEGGVFNATGTGSMQTNTGASLLSGLTLNGPLGLNAGHTVRVDGDGMTNNGVISMNPQASSADSILNFTDNAMLDGVGEINLKSQGADTQLNSDPTFVVVHGVDHVIRGVGYVNAALDNHGRISADASVATFGSNLALRGQDKVNRGEITVETGSTLDVTGIVLSQLGSGVMRANDGQFRFNSAATLMGNSIEHTGAGNYFVNGATTFENVTSNTPGSIEGGDILTVDGAGFTNNELLTVNPTQSSADGILRFPSDGLLSGTGEVNLLAAALDSQINGPGIVTNGSAHTISGRGTVSTELVNNGIIAPGNNTIGTLNASDDVTFSASSSMAIEVGSANQSDRFAISGTANLGGTLDLTTVPSFQIGNQIDYIILTAGDVVGTFDTENLLVDGQLVTRILYEPTQVRLVTRCIADTNLDGTVTPTDFTAWVNAFNNQNPVADQNLDGNITPTDFTAWIANFNAGCP